MKVEDIIIGTPVIYYQKVSAAGFNSDPVQTVIESEPWHTSEKHFCKLKGFSNFIDINQLEKFLPPSKQVLELQSLINRTKAAIEQVKVMDIFTQYDRKILVPRYESNLLALQTKLKHYEREDLKRAKEIPVRDAVEVSGRS